MLRSACHRAVTEGERAIWIDGAGTLTGDGWTRGPLLVRPSTRVQGLESAEEMLYAGAAALVVVMGCAMDDTERIRLSRAVREGGAALVVVNDSRFLGGVQVTTIARADDYRWTLDAHGEPAAVTAVRVHARVTAQGWDRRSVFALSVKAHELRLSMDPELADRRGVAR